VKRLFTLLPALAAFAVLCLAHAANAASVGSLSCTETNGNDIKFNVSYFTFGLTQTANLSTGTGGGTGKATYQPLEVHAALSTFSTLLLPAVQRVAMQSCMLTTILNDGTTATFEFKPALIKELTVVAEKTGTTETPAQYTDVQFAYGQVELKTSGGTDDGGTTPATGTNKITIIGGAGSGEPN
jgi:hypothetical protein